MEIGKAPALLTAIASPSIGPATITLFGLQVPLAAMSLSLLGLILARYIAPKSARRLTKGQERALTLLLAIVLFVVVSGEISMCEIRAMLSASPSTCVKTPLNVGMATAWGIGLGTSGLLMVEFFGKRFADAMKAMFGGSKD